VPDLPNVIRCPDCGVIVILDLLGEGFSAEEVARKQARHQEADHA
jgi:hypothetical protein